MQQSLRSLFLFAILIISLSFISAIPQLTINSPGNTTYNSTQVLLNVTSNETVDFFIQSPRGLRSIVLAENSTVLNDYLYLNEGEHEFTIWANNSNGETNATIFFTTTIHNPINVTSCGIIRSSDTEYVLQNDISTSGSRCMTFSSLRNVSFNLNGYVINSGTHEALLIDYSS